MSYAKQYDWLRPIACEANKMHKSQITTNPGHLESSDIRVEHQQQNKLLQSTTRNMIVIWHDCA
jgi:hypothetical protein